MSDNEPRPLFFDFFLLLLSPLVFPLALPLVVLLLLWLLLLPDTAAEDKFVECGWAGVDHTAAGGEDSDDGEVGEAFFPMRSNSETFVPPRPFKEGEDMPTKAEAL